MPEGANLQNGVAIAYSALFGPDSAPSAIDEREASVDAKYMSNKNGRSSSTKSGLVYPALGYSNVEMKDA